MAFTGISLEVYPAGEGVSDAGGQSPSGTRHGPGDGPRGSLGRLPRWAWGGRSHHVPVRAELGLWVRWLAADTAGRPACPPPPPGSHRKPTRSGCGSVTRVSMEPSPNSHPHVHLVQPSPHVDVITSAHRNRKTPGEGAVVILTRLHSTADPEIKDLVDLGFRVLSGVVPESDPQASPGTRYLEAEKGGVGGAKAKPGSADAQARCLPGAEGGSEGGSATPQDLKDLEPHREPTHGQWRRGRHSLQPPSSATCCPLGQVTWSPQASAFLSGGVT